MSFSLIPVRFLLAILFGAFSINKLAAQITTGFVEGTVRDKNGRAAAGVSIEATGSPGFRTIVTTDTHGDFTLALPYGNYRIGGLEIFVGALRLTRVDLTEAGNTSSPPDSSAWRVYPEPFSLAGVLLNRDPAVVTWPLDFTGLSDHRLPLVSDRAVSWTATELKLNGIDATDPYQPGRTVMLPDVDALSELSVREGFSQTASSGYGSAIGIFLAESGGAWHGTISTAESGSFFSWSNLPAPANRGIVQRSDYFHWFTRDGLQIGGPLTKWADIFASGTGQWSSETEPLAAPGNDPRSRLLYGNVRGRIRAGSWDRFDAVYSGSRINLTNFGMPAGMEALIGRRDSPSFVLPVGFDGQGETDHLDFLQAGWTRQLSTASGLGAIEVRYGFSTGHLDTNHSAPAASFPQSRIELLDGAVTGAPPLENLAVRTRQTIAGSWQLGWRRHRLTAGAGWQTAGSLNRLTAPSDMNVITANGAPAFVVELNTPLDTRARVRSFNAYAADRVRLTPSLSIEAGVLGDFSRGSLPAQSSPGGIFATPRSFPAQADLIAWNSISPRAAFAWEPPRLHHLTLRGAYFRVDAPLAARDLDFGNPNSLGGSEFQWMDRNGDGQFQPGELGALLMRFGGPYSSILPSLQRPYADEFDAGAEYRLAGATTLSIDLFRRDEKNRMAAIDTGVPFSAFTPVTVLDPGDGTPGAQRNLTVYSQNPSTFGQDRYLLTNPPGLRFQTSGYTAAVRTVWRGFAFHASFAAEKTWGPTNPGDAAIENDPGMVGTLFLDPNTLINARGRGFFDRAFIGKIQAAYRLPLGLELASTAVYLDGQVFARQLLVTGLAQGPIIVGATVRGSPEGGNRAEYIIDWNLRLQREFRGRVGRLVGAADLLNVINAGQKLQESDLSGPGFLERLPVAIQEARSLRLLLRWEF